MKFKLRTPRLIISTNFAGPLVDLAHQLKVVLLSPKFEAKMNV